MRMSFASATLLVSVSATVALTPCLWDKDTLKSEANGADTLVNVLTGRFDRFPPQYYEVRIERTEKALEQAPADLSLYDDLGVACDRIGRADRAIEWMAAKRGQLDALEAPDAFHEYTYLANLGTFHVHRWLRAGRDRSDLADVERAHELIAQAIELNPDAHFGRERYQLLAIDCLREPFVKEKLIREPSLLTRAIGQQVYATGQNDLNVAGYSDAIEGISGLIRLGAAWDSAAIWLALDQALLAKHDSFLARGASRRVVEITDADPVKAPFPGFDREKQLDHSRVTLYEKQLTKLDAWYAEARKTADAWRESRNRYLLKRLKDGVHPNDDPEFWSGWKDEHPAPTAKLKSGWFW